MNDEKRSHKDMAALLLSKNITFICEQMTQVKKCEIEDFDRKTHQSRSQIEE